MISLFKRKEPQLERKGYLLVVTLDPKEKTTLNFIYSKESSKFVKRKIFDIGGIFCDGFFASMEEAINTIQGKKDFKRFLGSCTVNGIYYVEIFIKKREQRIFSIETTTTKLFYVPSKMKLEVID